MTEEQLPLVSVVMSVYNGANALERSVESILQQQDVNIEFIIIDDGSTDDSLEILQGYAQRDPRVQLMTQDNRGLTASLITGCRQANGRYIARQDAGDRSLPGRLARQVNLLESDKSIVLVSGGTRFLAPDGEKLHIFQPDSDAADEALRQADTDLLFGPVHPSTLFRREDYFKVGGYRPEFRVAQDMDLWTRLVTLGRHAVIQDIICEVSLAARGVSGLQAGQQREVKRIIVEAMRARGRGQSDKNVLSQLESTNSRGSVSSRRRSDADFYYFVGCNLSRADSMARRKYFLRAVRSNPLSPRSWLRLIQACFYPGSQKQPGQNGSVP